MAFVDIVYLQLMTPYRHFLSIFSFKPVAPFAGGQGVEGPFPCFPILKYFTFRSRIGSVVISLLLLSTLGHTAWYFNSGALKQTSQTRIKAIHTLSFIIVVCLSFLFNAFFEFLHVYYLATYTVA